MKAWDSLICPVCGRALSVGEKAASCGAGHSFDRAKEGYFYLITRQGYSLSGDPPEAAKARRAFLSAGYYAILAKALTEAVIPRIKEQALLTDVCCGEGYYSGSIKKSAGDALSVTGFDLSKTAVKLAAKAYPENLYYTANISAIPQADASADILLHSFAPVHNAEFARILAPDGIFIDVIPSERHLWELKCALYGTPYENDGKSEADSRFTLLEQRKISGRIALDGEGLKNVLFMTPYAYRTERKAEERLLALGGLETEIGFIINIYKKA